MVLGRDVAMTVGPRNLITDVAGLTVGNAADSDLLSGVTVVVPEAPAVGCKPGWRRVAAASLSAVRWCRWCRPPFYSI